MKEGCVYCYHGVTICVPEAVTSEVQSHTLRNRLQKILAKSEINKEENKSKRGMEKEKLPYGIAMQYNMKCSVLNKKLLHKNAKS